jgi:hypothetical protein
MWGGRLFIYPIVSIYFNHFSRSYPSMSAWEHTETGPGADDGWKRGCACPRRLPTSWHTRKAEIQIRWRLTSSGPILFPHPPVNCSAMMITARRSPRLSESTIARPKRWREPTQVDDQAASLTFFTSFQHTRRIATLNLSRNGAELECVDLRTAWPRKASSPWFECRL